MAASWQALAHVEDASAFVQVAVRADPAPAAAAAAVETGTSRAGWPDLDNIVDSVKGKGKDILDSATSKLVSAMQAVAEGMTEALSITQRKITDLKVRIKKEKSELVAKCDLNDNGQLQNLKTAVDAYIDNTQKEWTPFRVALQGIERAIMEAMQLAGEGELAVRINATLVDADARMDVFFHKSEGAKDVAFDNVALGITATRKAGEAYVRDIMAVLNDAKGELKTFQVKFTEAFKEMERAMDQHVSGLLEPSQAQVVHEAFSGVTQNATTLAENVESVEDEVLLAFEGEQWPGSILGKSASEKSGAMGMGIQISFCAMLVSLGLLQL